VGLGGLVFSPDLPAPFELARGVVGMADSASPQEQPHGLVGARHDEQVPSSIAFSPKVPAAMGGYDGSTIQGMSHSRFSVAIRYRLSFLTPRGQEFIFSFSNFRAPIALAK
jgi:hypothetical protein